MGQGPARRLAAAAVCVWLLAQAHALSAHEQRRRIHELQQKKQQAKKEQWQKAHAALPQRPRSSQCDHTGRCFFKGVSAALVQGQGLMFCKDCPDPHSEGSHMETWEARFSPGGFHVDGEIVFAVPNDARTEVLNPLGGTIAIVERGEVPFATKAGANAVIIIDDGTCSEDFVCGGWIGSKSEGPLARRDASEAWEGIYIPSVLITRRQSDRLRGLLDLTNIDIPGLGEQVYVVDY